MSPARRRIAQNGDGADEVSSEAAEDWLKARGTSPRFHSLQVGGIIAKMVCEESGGVWLNAKSCAKNLWLGSGFKRGDVLTKC